MPSCCLQSSVGRTMWDERPGPEAVGPARAQAHKIDYPSHLDSAFAGAPPKAPEDDTTVRFSYFPSLALALALASCGDDENNGDGPDASNRGDAAPAVQSCQQSECHGDPSSGASIEDAHPWAGLACTDCHGGDPEAETKEDSHVQPTKDWVVERRGYLRNLSVNELDDVDPAFLQFINPGDYRVAERGCGSGSAAAAGGDCHQDKVLTAPRSVMTTFAGHFSLPRFQAGMQDKPSELGSQTIESIGELPQPPGTVMSLAQATPPPDDAPRDEVHTLMDHYLTKNCTHCHAANFGRNDARGNFRSSGCTSCHMVYDNDGLSQSDDPSAIKNRPPHPVKHELTSNIPTTQCAHCHYQGARIGLLYRGMFEWGLDEEPPLPIVDEELHTHPPGFYLDGGEEYPGDLHWVAGMDCADCHVGRDVHGSEWIYSTAKYQVAVRCENCHGTIDEEISEGSAVGPLLPNGAVDEECNPEPKSDTHFLNCNGDPFENMVRDDDGKIWLELRNGKGRLPVNQIKPVLESGRNPLMVAGMGRDPVTGVSHTETVECSTCHTAYREYCFGCHVTMDYSSERADLLSGVATAGAEITTRDWVTFDMYFVGMNRRGKIGSFCPSMQVFTGAIDRDDSGDRVEYFQDRVRTTATGKVGFNWGIDMPHTTSARAQPCTICHADGQDDCSTTTAREVYGFGTGRYTLTDETGKVHDLTQMLDENGDPIVDFSHEGQGPVPKDMMQRALEHCIE